MQMVFVLRAFRYIIDEHVQFTLLAPDPRDQFLDLLRFQMVDHHRDSLSAARAYHFRRLFDRLRAVFVIVGRQGFPCFRRAAPRGFQAHGLLCARAAACAVDRCARFAERQRGAASHAACCARHERDAALQIWRPVGRVLRGHGPPPEGDAQ